MSTTTDLLLINNFLENILKTVIVKIDILDDFPICILLPTSIATLENKTTYISKKSHH